MCKKNLKRLLWLDTHKQNEGFINILKVLGSNLADLLIHGIKDVQVCLKIRVLHNATNIVYV